VPPDWLTALAWCWLGLAFVSAAVMLADIARGDRQPMGVMHAVWPITALYLGPVALLAYWRYGRPYTERHQREHATGMPDTLYRVRVALDQSLRRRLHCR
jgi:hypothetical protein